MSIETIIIASSETGIDAFPIPWTPEDMLEIPPQLERSSNLSLLWHRYMPAHNPQSKVDWQLTSGFGPRVFDESDQKHVRFALQHWSGYGALKWYCEAARRQINQEFLKENGEFDILTNRRREVARSLGPHIMLKAKAPWRVAVGLGNSATFENSGVAMHHTYGFPILPGSSLKGLTHHYFMEEFFPEAGEFKMQELRRRASGPPEPKTLKPDRSTERLLFGASAGDSDTTEGAIAFHDAWPLRNPEGWFDVDVLTVHHQAYYQGANVPADDTANPVPVHFLTLRHGTQFELPLTLTSAACRLDRPVRIHLLWFAAMLLRQALERWGVGAKTGSGYGRLVPIEHSQMEETP